MCRAWNNLAKRVNHEKKWKKTKLAECILKKVGYSPDIKHLVLWIVSTFNK